MHPSSMIKMEELLKEHAVGKGTDLADIGSFHVNGDYWALCEGLGFAYTGIDIREGRKVDVVVEDQATRTYKPWTETLGKQFDVVISGQCLEHVAWPWRWIEDVKSITKDGGTIIVIVPWLFQEHERRDCWRVLRDGMDALFEWASLDVIEVGHVDHDCFGVAVKG